MIVVDTNVIAYFLIRGEQSQAMDRLMDNDRNWIAPRLWLDEFINVRCTYERRALVTPDEAVALLDDALTLMEGSSYEVPPERVLAVARRTGCSGYDSHYVALAEDLGLKLYTRDKVILAKCPDIAVLPKDLPYQ